MIFSRSFFFFLSFWMLSLGKVLSSWQNLARPKIFCMPLLDAHSSGSRWRHTARCCVRASRKLSKCIISWFSLSTCSTWNYKYRIMCTWFTIDICQYVDYYELCRFGYRYSKSNGLRLCKWWRVAGFSAISRDARDRSDIALNGCDYSISEVLDFLNSGRTSVDRGVS